MPFSGLRAPRSWAWGLLLVWPTLACSAAEGDVFLLRSTIEPKNALAAEAFVDSLGVDVRLGWPDTFYASRLGDLVLPALSRLRVRHVRDDSTKALIQERLVDATSQLVAQLPPAGISTTWILDPRLDITEQRIPELLSLGGSAVEAIEGPARSNYAGRVLSDQELRDYMGQLAEQVSDSLPVVAPSANQASVGAWEQWVDYGHVTLPLSDEPPHQLLEEAIALASQNSPGRPLIATSPGYHTGSGVALPAVPESVAAKYVLRLLAGNFERRIVRTFVSPLLDLPLATDPEETSRRGLLRADGTEKPAFSALERLFDLVAEPGVVHLPGSLRYRLNGAPAGLHEVLLSSQSGRFYLLLWQAARSYDSLSASELVVPDLSLELELQTAHDVSVYYPLLTADPSRRERAVRRFALSVPDHPLVVVIEP